MGKTWDASSFTMNNLFERALDSLAHSINISTGVAHPNDFGRTVEMFTRLLDSGEGASQDEILDYLQKRHRMGFDEAQDIQRVYEVLAVARQPGRQTFWKDDILDQLRARP